MQISGPAAPPASEGIAGMLRHLASLNRPMLTYYAACASPGGEIETLRVEFTGRGIAQWSYKCANLLFEEGVASGDTVVLDLPPSWRAVPWILGTWLQGAAIALTPQPGAALVVTDRPSAVDADLVVAVPGNPLALLWDPGSDGPLPPGALDGAADVAAQADQPLGPARRDPSALAFADAGVRFADLDAVIGHGPDGRNLIVPGNAWDLARRTIAVWRSGGSVVAVDGRVPEETRLRAGAQEGVRRE